MLVPTYSSAIAMSRIPSDRASDRAGRLFRGDEDEVHRKVFGRLAIFRCLGLVIAVIAVQLPG